MELRTIKISDIQQGPIRHTSLPQSMITRIQSVFNILNEFMNDPIEVWIEDFQRDMHPDREVLIWEAIAYTFDELRKEIPLTKAAQKELYVTLLVDTTGGSHECKHLSKELVQDAKSRMKNKMLQLIDKRIGRE